MTKADLVELVYERVGCSRREAGGAVVDIFEIMKERLRRGEKVKISGFGSFIVCRKHARRGRNPQTGATIIIDPRCVLSFKPSQVLKGRVCNGHKSW